MASMTGRFNGFIGLLEEHPPFRSLKEICKLFLLLLYLFRFQWLSVLSNKFQVHQLVYNAPPIELIDNFFHWALSKSFVFHLYGHQGKVRRQS